MHEIVHSIEHSITDTLPMIPFLFLSYLLMEWLEHRASDKMTRTIRKSGKAGPLIGGLLGVLPQCGFSASMTSLYAGKVVSLGTLLAVFLSTSDEMLPILISESVGTGEILKILGIKVGVAVVVGFLIDRIVFRNELPQEHHYHIHSLCEHEHCRCEEGIIRSAIRHTLQIAAFVFVVNLAMSLVVALIGEDVIKGVIFNKPILGEALAGLVGLIPNCASSVVITELYLQGVLSFGAMMSGLLVGSGIGILVLFRVNQNLRENLTIVGLLYAIGVLSGILLGLLFS